MKPDWKDAPVWANWLVLNASGIYHWFEVEPMLTYERRPVVDEEGVNNEDPTPSYYNHTFDGKKLDVYRVQLSMGITHPIQAHIHKKISRIHLENHKNTEQTLREIKQACDRWLEIIEEDKENEN